MRSLNLLVACASRAWVARASRPLSLTILALVMLAAGCRTGTPPDPNDPVVAAHQPEVLRRNLQGASDMLDFRKARGEITDEEYRAKIKEYAQGLLNESKLTSVEPGEAYLYAEVLITAQQWEKAKDALQQAVKHALETKNQDRRVND